MAVNSKEYWHKREEENLKKNLKTEEEYIKTINGYYDYMMDQIQKEINGFYAKYAKKEGITLAEAKKRVSELDIKAYERKAAKYVKEKNFSEEANDEMRLYNATMKINRLEMLKANIGLELVDGFNDLQKYYEQVLTDRTLSEFERQAGILGKTINNNAQAANAIVNASFANAKFSDRIWMYQDMMKAELSKLLQEGLIQGRNPRQLARHLEKLFGVSKENAERLMRTELARVQIEAQKQSFERNGFEQYEFIALGSACEICKELDGKHFEVKKMMPGENAPPMHPNCRCTVAAWMDDKEYDEWLDYLDKGGTTEEWNNINRFRKNAMKISMPDEVYKKCGMTENTKNKINTAIKKLESDYIIYIDKLEGAHVGNKKDIFLTGGFFEDGILKHSIVFNYDINYEKIEKRMNKVYTSRWVAGKNFEDYLAHEVAHIIPFQNCVTEADYKELNRVLKNSFISGVSGYADSTKDGRESLAEAFVRYRNGEKVPNESEKLIRKYIEPWRR
ncbi:minor capsid protein [Bariatricus sp. SGI.161]|uniref:minor capsid protein n=1 Tax=Bariatricus sp. SGI.161 TaxID=3420550 RepID=UPI003D01B216